ncbi:MAG: amino acid permease, partial [Candidatus Bathyarchaeota archaeon]
FPKILGKIHKSCDTPHVAIILSAIIIAVFSVIDNLEFVVYSINFGFLLGFSMVNLSLIKLRRSQPHLNRPFRTPLYPLMPIIGIATSLMLLAFFEVKPLAFGTAWGLLGTIVYYFRLKNEYHPT